MSGGLPELLDALAETLLRPGAFPSESFRAIRQGAWVPPSLAVALDALLVAPAADLDVEYAGLFLVGREAPAVHLELSVASHGRHLAPELVTSLEPIYAEAGLAPPEGLSLDHLGLLLALLAHNLRRLGCAEDSQTEANSLRLVQEYLLPFCRGLRSSMGDAHPFYTACLELTGATLIFAADLLA